MSGSLIHEALWNEKEEVKHIWPINELDSQIRRAINLYIETEVLTGSNTLVQCMKRTYYFSIADFVLRYIILFQISLAPKTALVKFPVLYSVASHMC